MGALSPTLKFSLRSSGKGTTLDVGKLGKGVNRWGRRGNVLTLPDNDVIRHS